MALLIYTAKRLPVGSPAECRSSQQRRQEGNKVLVVLVGDSIVHGTFGRNWVVDLRNSKLGNTHEFVNGGMNSNLAWNVDQRLAPILDLQP